MKTIKYLIAAIIFLTGCANQHTTSKKITTFKPELSTSAEKRWKMMTGKWYGSQPTKNGGIQQHIIEHSVDGTSKITFRIKSPKGDIKEFSEVGQWGISGPIYFTILSGRIDGKKFRPSDQTNPYNYDAYQIVNLTKDEFEYNHFSSDNKYKIIKVPKSFTFPDKSSHKKSIKSDSINIKPHHKKSRATKLIRQNHIKP